MKLLIANMSNTITDSTFSGVLAAIGQQVTRDFQPEWHVGATLTGKKLLGLKAKVDVPTDAVIYVGDSSQDPTTGVEGALGYHSQNHRHKPYGFIYLDICQRYGENWTSTLSHEVLELLGDPTAVLTVRGPKPPHATTSRPSVYYDLEVCDPTQGDSYKINNVEVSNFVTRAYFDMAGGASPATNFLKLDLASFGVRPGGYFQYEDEHGAHQIDGAKVTADHKAARKAMSGYRRNGRRAMALAIPPTAQAAE